MSSAAVVIGAIRVNVGQVDAKKGLTFFLKRSGNDYIFIAKILISCSSAFPDLDTYLGFLSCPAQERITYKHVSKASN